MKLKRLEMLGFKSFMDATVVSFEKDITAVVGPNGCGKSNIVDSIRWVLGEQSAKHLRGQSMEDVIFSGSEKRPALSLASVELTFSTEGYQTPPAYAQQAEISIGRKLYRTGESEYFINKIPCRLKDITDLFLGTGVGTKAYSVIEQGRISQIVTAKPEERRYYIEEVAGVSKFKARKEAALRKMELTQQNLLRLTDLITELERQLKSLDRQAKKAEKYRLVKTEYQALDLALLSRDYQRLAQSQQELEATLRSVGEEEATFKAQLLEAENRVETQKIDLLDFEKQVSTLQNQLFELTNLLRLTENKLGYRNQESEKGKEHIQDLTQRAHALEAQAVSIVEGLESINEQKLTLDLDKEALQTEVAGLEEEAKNAEKDLTEGTQELETLQNTFFQKQKRFSELGYLIQNEEAKKEALVSQIQREEAEYSELESRHKKIRQVYDETRFSLESLKQLKLDLTAQTDLLTSDLSTQKENLKLQESEMASLRSELNLKKSRFVSLEELQRNFEGYEEGTRAVLKHKQEAGMEGIVGTIADLVDTDPAYEGAVSAVLGEKLNYVLVQSQSQGMEAVDYLKTAATGRSSFVPMNLKLHSQDTGEIETQEGVLGPLGKFVRLKNNSQDLAQFLFGDVVLVSDLRKALDLFHSNGHQKKLVTLDGEVVDSAGVISGGSTSSASKALLEKKRELKELAILLSRLEVDLHEKELTCRALTERVQALEISLATVKNSSFEEGVKLANQEKDVEHFKVEMDGLEAKVQKMKTRVFQAHQDLETMLPQMSTHVSEREELRHAISNMEIQLASTKEAVSNRRREHEGRREIWTRKKIELGSVLERLQSVDASLTREVTRQLDTEYLRHENREDLSNQEARLAMIDREIYHLQRFLDKKAQQRLGVEENHSKARIQYEELSHSIRNAETSLRELRKFHEEAQAKLNGVTLELSQARSSLRHLIEQCFERHQVTLPEVYEQHLQVELDMADAMVRAQELREQLSKMGDVNVGAFEEYEQLRQRFEFLVKQKDDLTSSLAALERAITKINRTTKEKFFEAFNRVNEKFQLLFPKLFNGGKASLQLTDENNLLETGIEIIAQPPGKKLQSISLLSGGEKALTAVSLVFSIFQIKPSPFCILDEVDAPLDEANVVRYNELIREMTPKTQFIVISHNKQTMEMADILYGVTMQEAGVSQLVSVALN